MEAQTQKNGGIQREREREREREAGKDTDTERVKETARVKTQKREPRVSKCSLALEVLP